MWSGMGMWSTGKYPGLFGDVRFLCLMLCGGVALPLTLAVAA